MFPPRTVLAAVDLSEASRVALTFAARLARHVGAELHVIWRRRSNARGTMRCSCSAAGRASTAAERPAAPRTAS